MSATEVDEHGNLLITVRCCRDWQVYRIFQGQIYDWQSCGICGEIPEPVKEQQ